MAGGQDVDGEAAFPLKDGIPVSLENRFLAVAPSLKMGPDAEGADDLPHLGPKRRCRGIIQMIPVVVRNEQIIDVRHVLGGVKVRPLERPVGEKDRRSIGTEHGIYQKASAAELHEVGRMAEPDDGIRIPVEPPQVGFR